MRRYDRGQSADDHDARHPVCQERQHAQTLLPDALRPSGGGIDRRRMGGADGRRGRTRATSRRPATSRDAPEASSGGTEDTAGKDGGNGTASNTKLVFFRPRRKCPGNAWDKRRVTLR